MPSASTGAGPSGSAITAQGLHKRFGATVALDGLDLDVRRGEVHGFLGPNGSGKSVTIRILLGLLRADAGTATVLGADPWHHAVDLHRHLAYVPGDVALWPNLTGGEVIDLLSSLRGGVDRSRRADLLEAFDLDPRRRCSTYSKGNRQKVALVAAFASDAELLLLDEPTAGLDPLMAHVFQDRVREAAARGCTVLLSSHVLAEVEELCDRVTIIRRGRAVEQGALDELRHVVRTAVTVTTDRPVGGLASVSGVYDLDVQGDVTTFTADPAALGQALTVVAAAGVRSLVSRPPTLEELFLRHYGDDLAGAS